MKISQALLLLAAATALAGGYDKLYANDKGELFTDYSLALNSVGFDNERLETLTPAHWEGIDPEVQAPEQTAPTGETAEDENEAQEEKPAPKKTTRKK